MLDMPPRAVAWTVREPRWYGPPRLAGGLMRWLQVNAVVLVAVALAGCPSEFGKDGRIGKAVEKDVNEQFKRVV